MVWASSVVYFLGYEWEYKIFEDPDFKCLTNLVLCIWQHLKGYFSWFHGVGGKWDLNKKKHTRQKIFIFLVFSSLPGVIYSPDKGYYILFSKMYYCNYYCIANLYVNAHFCVFFFCKYKTCYKVEAQDRHLLNKTKYGFYTVNIITK